ncbi:hypothetical protein NL676_024388 [Syzygium grande]|nr:hypothetical protein NL676_024388 [Syzygium grande]
MGRPKRRRCWKCVELEAPGDAGQTNFEGGAGPPLWRESRAESQLPAAREPWARDEGRLRLTTTGRRREHEAQDEEAARRVRCGRPTPPPRAPPCRSPWRTSWNPYPLLH